MTRKGSQVQVLYGPPAQSMFCRLETVSTRRGSKLGTLRALIESAPRRRQRVPHTGVTGTIILGWTVECMLPTSRWTVP
jgi:hypothetical protein